MSDAVYESADAGTEYSGGAVVSAAVGAGAARGVSEGFAGGGGGSRMEETAGLGADDLRDVRAHGGRDR